jgi:hypothetical protein
MHELVTALLQHDALHARHLVMALDREPATWQQIQKPCGWQEEELSLAAGVIETMCERRGLSPPEWTREIPAIAQPRYLVQAAETMPRLRKLCEEAGPEALRRRNFYAPPDFLQQV